MKVLIACEFSGIVRDAFRARGHDAYSCDILPSETGAFLHHYECDVRQVLDMEWDLMISHPPCTHLAVSGARWFKEKRREQEEAIEFVKTLLDAPIDRIALENPISVISSKVRKPDQIIQPWMFGHGETKATCLWLKNLPPLKPTKIVEGRKPRVHYAPPGTGTLERTQPHIAGNSLCNGRTVGYPMSYEGDLATHYHDIRQKLIGSPPIDPIAPSFPRQTAVTRKELEAFLLKIQAIEDRLVTLELEQERQKQEQKEQKVGYPQVPQTPELTVNDVYQLVRRKEKTKGDVLLGVRRDANVARVRHIIFYLAATKTHRSMPQIGMFMKRDHSSVIHGRDQIAHKRLLDPLLDIKLQWYEAELERIKENKAQAYLTAIGTVL